MAASHPSPRALGHEVHVVGAAVQVMAVVKLDFLVESVPLTMCCCWLHPYAAPPPPPFAPKRRAVHPDAAAIGERLRIELLTGVPRISGAMRKKGGMSFGLEFLKKYKVRLGAVCHLSLTNDHFINLLVVLAC